MVRPSISATLNESLENLTSATRSPAVNAKMPMPSLQECIVSINMDMRRLIRFMAVEVEAVRPAPKYCRHLEPSPPHILASPNVTDDQAAPVTVNR
jgi:hypothetical protein